MIISGTGHRPNKLGGYSDIAFEKLVKVITKALEELKPDTVISGMALGFDQALAESSINLGIQTIAYIPFKGQHNMWPQKSQDKYFDILTKCQLFICNQDPNITQIYNKTISDIKLLLTGSEYKPELMQRRNELMVDHCDKLLTIYNGDLSGGTYNCITYAKSKNKEIINLYEQWKLM